MLKVLPMTAIAASAIGLGATPEEVKERIELLKLSLEFRYLDNEVQLNKTAARDGGILFHSTGEDGRVASSTGSRALDSKENRP